MLRFIRKQFDRSWRLALATSLLFHSAILIVISLRSGTSNSDISASHSKSIIQSTALSESESSNNDPWSDNLPSNALPTTMFSPSELQKEVDQFHANPDQNADNADKNQSYVATQIQRSVRIGQSRKPERNEKDLTTLSERLSRESNEKSIDQLAKFIGGITGSPRATSPQPNEQGKPFDPKTAQFNDVKKETDEKLVTHFIATLVDAQGVSIDVEMDLELGEQLHRTMKLIKSNPLLERVYRQMVMGLLDQILSSPKVESSK